MEKLGRIQANEKLTMIRDENGDDSVSMSTYSQSECQKNPQQTDLFVTSQNSY